MSTSPPAAGLPPLAARVAAIEPFHVMELVKRAVALERAGHDIVHLSIGEPDFTAPAPVVEALHRAAAAGRTGYTAALGFEPLRRAIAAHCGTAWGVEVDPARVVVTAGASAALLLACAALVNPGDRVLMSDPGYPCNRHFVTAFGGRAQAVPVGPATRFQLDAAALERHWTPEVRGVLLASPANPTGTSVPFDELARIVAAARARGGFMLVDEIYLGLHYDGPARSALELGDDLVVINSFSKYFSMTGWRLGWLIVPPAWAPAFEKLAQNLYICASSLAQQAALACFAPECLDVFEARRREFQARRDFIVPALRGLGFDVPVTPDGAFYAWLDVARFTADSERFAVEMLEGCGVSMVPGMDFGANEPQRWMRLSYATGMERLEAAVERLARWLPRRAA